MANWNAVSCEWLIQCPLAVADLVLPVRWEETLTATSLVVRRLEGVPGRPREGRTTLAAAIRYTNRARMEGTG